MLSVFDSNSACIRQLVIIDFNSSFVQNKS